MYTKKFLDTKLNKLKTAVLVDRNHKNIPSRYIISYHFQHQSKIIFEFSINDNEINAC